MAEMPTIEVKIDVPTEAPEPPPHERIDWQGCRLVKTSSSNWPGYTYSDSVVQLEAWPHGRFFVATFRAIDHKVQSEPSPTPEAALDRAWLIWRTHVGEVARHLGKEVDV